MTGLDWLGVAALAPPVQTRREWQPEKSGFFRPSIACDWATAGRRSRRGDTATAEGESVFSGTRALTAGYRFLRWALIQWRAPVVGLAFMNRRLVGR